MAKTRGFSIFLMKAEFRIPEDALKPDHDLQKAEASVTSEHQWSVYVKARRPQPPWWATYFSIADKVEQAYAGAIVFITTSDRTFALTFGQTRHSLRDEAYEYDFGLRTTLNAVEPTEIRNTDELDPATSRRRRTQLPERADLTYFDFDGNSAVLRSLTGAIRPEYKGLFSHATGASNLRVSSKKPVTDLSSLLDEIFGVYQMETYLEAFPAANNIQPVADPVLLDQLNQNLVEAIRGNEDAILTIPEFVDFREDFEVGYSGVGRSDLYTDAALIDYYDYLDSNGHKASDLSLESLRQHRLQVLTDDNVEKASYSIYRCLVYETMLPGVDEAFHLSEGTWYKVDTDYLARLTADLDDFFVQADLPARTMRLESDYNGKQLVPHWDGSVLLDKTNTSPSGESQVEPCDVARVEGSNLVLTHVKLGVKAGPLSHLFGQGTTAVDLLNGVPEARTHLRALLLERKPDFNVTPLENMNFAVEYVIVTKKDSVLASRALPLFSRISLRRAARALAGMRTRVTVHLVRDEYEGQSREKPRRAQKPKGPVAFE